MPDDQTGSSHVSLRLPNDLIDAYDKLAAELERPRSWVMLRALRMYLEEEGAEIIEDGESLAQLDRGEIVTSEDLLRNVRAIIDAAREKRSSGK